MAGSGNVLFFLCIAWGIAEIRNGHSCHCTLVRLGGATWIRESLQQGIVLETSLHLELASKVPSSEEHYGVPSRWSMQDIGRLWPFKVLLGYNDLTIRRFRSQLSEVSEGCCDSSGWLFWKKCDFPLPTVWFSFKSRTLMPTHSQLIPWLTGSMRRCFSVCCACAISVHLKVRKERERGGIEERAGGYIQWGQLHYL